MIPPEPIDDAVAIRGFFDAIAEALIVLDAYGLVVAANDAALGLVGHAGLRLGVPFATVVDPADRQRVESATLRAAGSGSLRLDVALRAASGDAPVPVTISVSGFVADDKALCGVVVIDRTAALEAHRRLEAREEQYRMMFTHAPVALREEDFSKIGVWMDDLRRGGVTDLDEYLTEHPDEVVNAIRLVRTRRVNPALVRLVGAKNEAEVLSIGFADVELTEDVLTNFRDQFVGLWNGVTRYEADFEGRNHRGEPFYSRIHWAVPVIDGTPDLSRVIAGILDMTTAYAAQRYLEGLIEERDRFIASVSHELRTPLATIFGLSHELHERWEDFTETDVRSLVELMAAQSAFLTGLVEDLLLVAKLEAGDIPLEAEPVDLQQLAVASIEEVSRSDTPVGEVRVTGQPVMCVADAARVRQIVRNLLTNAAKYGGEHVRIEVSHDTMPTLRVCDDGIGIPDEHRAAVFEPYQRGAAPTSIGSLGLGLAISRELARAMGGDLDYRYADGESVFTLTLRVADTAVS